MARREGRRFTLLLILLCQHAWYIFNTGQHCWSSKCTVWLFTCIYLYILCVINPWFFFLLIWLLSFSCFLYVLSAWNGVMWHFTFCITLASWDCIYKLRNWVSLIPTCFQTRKQCEKSSVSSSFCRLTSQPGAGQRQWCPSRDVGDQRSWPWRNTALGFKNVLSNSVFKIWVISKKIYFCYLCLTHKWREISFW